MNCQRYCDCLHFWLSTRQTTRGNLFSPKPYYLDTTIGSFSNILSISGRSSAWQLTRFTILNMDIILCISGGQGEAGRINGRAAVGSVLYRPPGNISRPLQAVSPLPSASSNGGARTPLHTFSVYFVSLSPASGFSKCSLPILGPRSREVGAIRLAHCNIAGLQL